jgi:hypothetical protein
MKDHTNPAEGGTYIRKADGSLHQVEPPTKPHPGKSAASDDAPAKTRKPKKARNAKPVPAKAEPAANDTPPENQE